MVRSTHIHLIPVGAKYYSFIISLDKYNEVVMSYLQKYVFQNKQKT